LLDSSWADAMQQLAVSCRLDHVH